LKHPQSNHWFKPSQLFQQQIDPSIRSWLNDPDSLTRRLQDHCPGQFHVDVLATDWVRPDLGEADLLGIRRGENVLLRQVYLKCADEICVYARSVIPLKTLRRKHRRLKYLSNKPLGAYLFAHPHLQRSEIEWSRLIPGTYLHSQACKQTGLINEPVWGRRSLFRMGQAPLLVSEFFMPALVGSDVP
jgi:chorismate--pyruvate lyase